MCLCLTQSELSKTYPYEILYFPLPNRIFRGSFREKTFLQVVFESLNTFLMFRLQDNSYPQCPFPSNVSKILNESPSFHLYNIRARSP
jgi:hypothetical protein